MLTIQLFGLSAIDASSLKSMLGLAKDLLRNQWKIVESGHIDLAIYSFESDEGLAAWESRTEGLTALLSKTGNITEPVDIVIKKPLRTSNFSDALNLIAEKILIVEEVKPEAPVEVKPEVKSETKKSVFSNLSKGINKYLPTKAEHQQVSIIANLPTLDAAASSTITDINELRTWLDGIAKIHNKDNVDTLLKNLIPLNRLKLNETKRADLMESYCNSIFALLANRKVSSEIRIDSELRQEAALIKASLLLLEELNNGYKRIINECINKGEKVATNPLLLYATVKVAEITGILLLFCYQHYRSQPATHFEQLHKLYLFCEQAALVETKPSYKTYNLDCSFAQLYKQTLLISIADPYNLERFEASRLFNLLKKIGSDAEIKVLTQNQIEASSDFFMTGHFCIDAEDDAIPKAMNKTPVEIRQKQTSRLLNIQPVLLKLEKIFKQTAATAMGGGFDLDIRLLKKVTPQLNTTYERRYERIKSTNKKPVMLVQGIQNIHETIRQDHLKDASEWQVKNQSGSGLMLSRVTAKRPGLYIGDILAIFEQDQALKLMVIRWLQIDQNNMINIGVQSIIGQPIHVVCTPINETTMYPALLIPQDEHNAQKVLLTDKGMFTRNRSIRVSGDGEPYVAKLKTLLDSSYYFEKFDYQISHTS